MKNNLKIERVKSKLTQQRLAEMIKVSRQTINAVEKGRFVPSTVLSLKMAQFFRIPVEALFELDDGD
jgi:putative transcriptional regulator